MSKLYKVIDIRSIFESCRNKNKSFNFAAIRRIRTLINLVYNNRNSRLDIPIQEFMNKTYDLISVGKLHKNEIAKFIRDFSIQYAVKASTDQIIIVRSEIAMKKLNDTFTNMFKCLVDVSRPNKEGIVKVKKIDLLWKERSEYDKIGNPNKIFILAEFLEGANIDKQIVDSDDDE